MIYFSPPSFPFLSPSLLSSACASSPHPCFPLSVPPLLIHAFLCLSVPPFLILPPTLSHIYSMSSVSMNIQCTCSAKVLFSVDHIWCLCLVYYAVLIGTHVANLLFHWFEEHHQSEDRKILRSTGPRQNMIGLLHS